MVQAQFYIPEKDHLKNVVHSIWQVQRLNTFKNEHIIPKGIIEIIFNFSGGPIIPGKLGRKPFQISDCIINGFNKTPIKLDLNDQQEFFGVRFQPLAIKKLFRIPASEFSDTAVDLSLFDPSFKTLWYQLIEQKDFHKRVGIFCAWVEKKVLDWHPQEKLMNDFLSSSGQHEMTVKSLANTLFYSPRHLSRKILEATGMNTEELLLYKKYLFAVDLMHSSKLSLTEIAYASHFTDQSHFIKSFNTYTGMTPGEYRRNKTFLQGHLYENVR